MYGEMTAAASALITYAACGYQLGKWWTEAVFARRAHGQACHAICRPMFVPTTPTAVDHPRKNCWHSLYTRLNKRRLKNHGYETMPAAAGVFWPFRRTINISLPPTDN